MSNIVTVDFRNDTLFAVERDDGVFVAVSPICQSLGVSPDRQRDRIQRDPILSEGATMMVFPSAGGKQETFCLKLELVNGWLFGIDESRVKDEETRQRVLAYKRECYGVLFKHFYGRSFEERRQTFEPRSGARPDLDDNVVVKKSLVTEARHTFNVQSARELLFKLGMPTTPSMYADPAQGEFFYYHAIKKDPVPPSDKKDAA